MHRWGGWRKQKSNQEPLLEIRTSSKAHQIRLHTCSGMDVFHPSMHPCLTHSLTLAHFSPFGCIPFNMATWQYGKKLRWEEARGRHTRGSNCSKSVLSLLLESCPRHLSSSGRVPLLLNSALQMLPPPLLQRAESLLAFLSWPFPCPPSCFLPELPGDFYAEICVTDRTLLSGAAVARDGCDI